MSRPDVAAPRNERTNWILSSFGSPLTPLVFLSSNEWFWRQKQIPVDPEMRGLGRPKATWYKDLTPWSYLPALDVLPPSLYQTKPAGYKRSDGPIPVVDHWRELIWLLTYAAIPLSLHALYVAVYPDAAPSNFTVGAFYSVYFAFFAGVAINHCHYLLSLYGAFDEENRARDIISDSDMAATLPSVLAYFFLRGAMAPFTLYDPKVSPLAGFSLLTPVKIVLWSLAIDYYFYVYHRACHEVPWLWQVHRKHHMTRHPTALLGTLADPLQEFIEFAIVPFLACITVPLTMGEQWLMFLILFEVEAFGHSGAKVFLTTPVGVFLRPFGLEISIEDHDIHHRGGKSGRNYGKGTRIWDAVFNTIEERVEKQPYDRPKLEKWLYGENVYTRVVPMRESE